VYELNVRIFTIGHGARSADELLDCLVEAGVRTLVDVRRFPGSRRHPQFNREALELTLEDAGIAYRHAEALGGRRRGGAEFECIRVAAFRGYAAWMRTEEFAVALAAALAQPDPCFMCAETLWWQCHRRLIAELLDTRGHAVVHLLRPGRSDRHRRWEPISESRDGVLYLCGERVG
jgi:uncharacterized protein (DUF488 family)